ncbi:hypothetical protein XENOCAPTIV_021036, partial [Xenoophorus captivus]
GQSGIRFRHQCHSHIGKVRSNAQTFPIHEPSMCLVLSAEMSPHVMPYWLQTVGRISQTEADPMGPAVMRHASVQKIHSTA